jgi:hypothetical protein
MEKSKRRNSIHKNNSKISLGLGPNNPTTSFHAKSDSTTPPPPHLYLQHTVSYRSSTLAIKCICLQQYPEVHMLDWLLRSICVCSRIPLAIKKKNLVVGAEHEEKQHQEW